MDGHHDVAVATLRCVGECSSLVSVDLLCEVCHLDEHVVEFRGEGVGGMVSSLLRFLSWFPLLRVIFQKPSALLTESLVVGLLGDPWWFRPSLACTCGLNSP